MRRREPAHCALPSASRRGTFLENIPSLSPMKKFAPLFALAFLAGCLSSGPDASSVSVSAVAADARSRLAADAMTDRAALSVSVADGVAVLSGPVATEAVHQRALQIVRGTPGVFAVEDRTFRQ
jgi:hypothetical protein